MDAHSKHSAPGAGRPGRCSRQLAGAPRCDGSEQRADDPSRTHRPSHRRPGHPMIAGLSGSLLSHEGVADHARLVATDDEVAMPRRRLQAWITAVLRTMGPASSARAVYDRVAVPLFSELGFRTILTRADTDASPARRTARRRIASRGRPGHGLGARTRSGVARRRAARHREGRPLVPLRQRSRRARVRLAPNLLPAIRPVRSRGDDRASRQLQVVLASVAGNCILDRPFRGWTGRFEFPRNTGATSGFRFNAACTTRSSDSSRRSRVLTAVAPCRQQTFSSMSRSPFFTASCSCCSPRPVDWSPNGTRRTETATRSSR